MTGALLAFSANKKENDHDMNEEKNDDKKIVIISN
jgi:hypothetical protein